MEKEKQYLIYAFVFSVLTAIFTFIQALPNGGNWKKMVISIVSGCLLIASAIISLRTAWDSVNEKTAETHRADSISTLLRTKQDTTNDNLRTSIALSRIQIDSTLKVLDTARAILRLSIKSNLLQKEISQLQTEVYNQVTGPTHPEQTFFSYLMINKKDKKPVLMEIGIPLNKEARPVIDYLHDIYSIYSGRNAEQGFSRRGPVNVYETSLLDLFQCKILNDMMDLQQKGLGMVIGMGYVDPLEIKTFELRTKKVLRYADLKKVMEGNLYFTDLGEIAHQRDSLILPEGAKLRIETEKGTGVLGSEGRKMIIYKEGYFDITIKVNGEMELGHVNKFSVINIPLEVLSNIDFYAVHVTLEANFQQSEAGVTGEYKQWADWLFENIRRLNTPGR